RPPHPTCFPYTTLFRSAFKNVVPMAPSRLEIKSDTEYFLAKKDTVDTLKIPDHLLQQWKITLQNLLPDYMVPKKIIAINHMPLKDRKSTRLNSSHVKIS